MLKRNKFIDATDRKFANQTISKLAQLTLHGQVKWHKQDGFHWAILGIWYIVIDGAYINFSRWNGDDLPKGRHSLATTQTGRLLNVLVTVPGAVEADRAIRDQTWADADAEAA